MSLFALLSWVVLAAPSDGLNLPPYGDDDPPPGQARPFSVDTTPGPGSVRRGKAPAGAVAEAQPQYPDSGTKQQFLLRTGPGVTSRIQVLHDGYTAQLFLSGIPKDLLAQLKGFKGVRAIATPAVRRQDGVMVYLGFDLPVHEASVRHDGPLTVISVTAANVNDAMARHVLIPMPSPEVVGDEAAKAFRAAENLLIEHNHVAARRSLALLLGNYGLKPWVQLRLADVTLLQDGGRAACDMYQHVADEYDTRAAGIIAAQRMFVLQCPNPQRQLIWTSLLSRSNADDAVGHRLGEETRWALNYIRDTTQLQQALRWGEHMLGKPLWEQLLARLLRTGDPLVVAEASRRYSEALRTHHDKEDLQVWIATAFCDLDVPREAARLVPRKNQRPWLAAAAACSTLLPVKDVPRQRDLEELQQKLDAMAPRLKEVGAAVAQAEHDFEIPNPSQEIP